MQIIHPRVALSLGGLIDTESGAPISYSKDNIIVVEDGIVKGIKVTTAEDTTDLLADIVFIIDTTGSMGPYIGWGKGQHTEFFRLP